MFEIVDDDNADDDLGQIFLLVDLRTLLCNFPESRKKIKFIFYLFFLFFPPTLNIICLVKKMIFF